jgi:hypothetical protein
MHGAPVQRTPYTAEFKTTHVRTLANGTTITGESTETRAVDGQGRIAITTVNSPEAGRQITYYSITDPVAGTNSSWNSTTQQVTVSQIPGPMSTDPQCAPKPSAAPVPVPGSTGRRQMATEDLGLQTIDGVEAHGHKTIITTPAGMEGNSEPLVTTHESWVATGYSPAFVVREMREDPVQGNSTRELTSLNPGEPDASLFQAPQGYRVVMREVRTTCAASAVAPVQAQPE